MEPCGTASSLAALGKKGGIEIPRKLDSPAHKRCALEKAESKCKYARAAGNGRRESVFHEIPATQPGKYFHAIDPTRAA